MPRICALAGIDGDAVPLLTAALKGAGEKRPPVETALDVRVLGEMRPDVLIGDLDGLTIDPLELLRQIRFVLPTCTIAVFSGDHRRTWGAACHMAGANCLLSKSSTLIELTAGLRDAVGSGCFTDPRFAA
jgi:DNA-binding NarL/FixJ family response regulator